MSVPRVLIVDDDEATSHVLRDALADEGYEAVAVADGAQALALLAKAGQPAPGVILPDVKMPHVDGWEFLQRYRALPGPQAAVILLTAGTVRAADPLPAGAAVLVPKPFDLDELLALIAGYIGTN